MLNAIIGYFYFRFEAADCPHAKAKEFLNVVREPLLSLAQFPDDTLLCDIYNVPGLHCMTGITAKLIKEIEKSFANNKETEEGTKFVNRFLAGNQVHRTVYQGSHSFEGNHARKLLEIIGRMRHEVEFLESKRGADKERIMKIIATIEAFDEVVTACFSKQLSSDYEAAIAAFAKAYMELHGTYKVSVPVKVHLVIDHIIPQIKRRHPGFGIGVVTEQAFESAHHAFKVEWAKTKIIDIKHKAYPQALLDCVVR